MKVALSLSIAALLAACSTSIPGLTSHTKIPLELKGYRTGMFLSDCPAAAVKAKRDGRVLTCILNDPSIGGTTVTSAGIIALDGSIVLIIYRLDQSGGFSQPGVLRALSDKFGPPARASQPKTHLWSNGHDQLQLEEIQGKITLMDTGRLPMLHAVQAKVGADDL